MSTHTKLPRFESSSSLKGLNFARGSIQYNSFQLFHQTRMPAPENYGTLNPREPWDIELPRNHEIPTAEKNLSQKTISDNPQNGGSTQVQLFIFKIVLEHVKTVTRSNFVRGADCMLFSMSP